jgi:hypothetical protein
MKFFEKYIDIYRFIRCLLFDNILYRKHRIKKRNQISKDIQMSDPINADFFKLSKSQDIARHIVDILQDIRFGSIEIVVHDGRIVQIDKHEKFRVKHDLATD